VARNHIKVYDSHVLRAALEKTRQPIRKNRNERFDKSGESLQLTGNWGERCLNTPRIYSNDGEVMEYLAEPEFLTEDIKYQP